MFCNEEALTVPVMVNPEGLAPVINISPRELVAPTLPLKLMAPAVVMVRFCVPFMLPLKVKTPVPFAVSVRFALPRLMDPV